MNPYLNASYAQLLAWFHDWTGNQFRAVDEARAILNYIRARLGEKSAFAIAFETAAEAEGKI
jgi:hypothetical protein